MDEYLGNLTSAKEKRAISGRDRIRKYMQKSITENQMTLLDHILAYPH